MPTPLQIAADVVAATRELHSFRFAGTITYDDGTVQVTGTVAGPGEVSIAERRGSHVVQVITLGSVLYMKADRAHYVARR